MPPSTTGPPARACARSTRSTRPPTAAGTPPAPSTPPARWPWAHRPTSPCGTPTTPCPPSSPGARDRPAGCSWSPARRSEISHDHPRSPSMSRLTLDPALVARARELAGRAAQPVVDLAKHHTTVSVERAVLRLAGLTGTDPVTGEGRSEDRVPWVNRVVDAVGDQVGLESGVALPVWHALAEGRTLQQLA